MKRLFNKIINILVQIIDNDLKVSVTDTGIGIKEENIPLIFNAFNTEIEKMSGTGLGLAIVKDLCTKMEAQIELFSPSLLSHNQFFPGTTVIIWLLKAQASLQLRGNKRKNS